MLFFNTYQRTSMNIKTLSAISYEKLTAAIPQIREDLERNACDFFSTQDFQQTMDNQFVLTSIHLPIQVWDYLQKSLHGFPETASFVRELGEYNVDPNKILAMLLLNLSLKDILELREVLGIPELTPQQ
jgi:hypothetical protein